MSKKSERERRRIDIDKDALRLAHSGECADWREVDFKLRTIRFLRSYTYDETKDYFNNPETKSKFDHRINAVGRQSGSIRLC